MSKRLFREIQTYLRDQRYDSDQLYRQRVDLSERKFRKAMAISLSIAVISAIAWTLIQLR